jgi:serine phosphatase RsbU (regulator of sigma subunit)
MQADLPPVLGSARLEVSNSEGRQIVPLAEDVIRLGRAGDNDVQVSDAHVSKRHAEIVPHEGGHLMRDVGSRAGVYCNGVLVRERVLRNGDQIVLGQSCSTRILYRTGDRSDGKSGDSVFLAAFAEAGPVTDAPSASGNSSLRNLARFLDLSRVLSGHLSSTEVVETVVDMVIEMTKADRGFIVLVGADGKLELAALRGRGAIEESTTRAPSISETLVRQVLEERKPKVVSNVAQDLHLAAAQSVMNLGLCSMAAIPLWRHVMPDASQPARATEEVFGVLCLDSQQSRNAFDRVHVGILETLARDASSAIENSRLLREAEQMRRLEAELARAREVQEALVPDSYWSDAHFGAAGSYVPCLDLGGDYVGQFRREDGSTAFVVADVCGKGVNAALLAAALQGALLVEFRSSHSLAEVVRGANQAIASVAPLGKFISMICCSLAPDGTLSYVNAGHCPLALVRRRSVEHLVTGEMALGLDADASYSMHTQQMAPGDRVVLYTDGVLEAMNGARELFGEERLEEVVAATHGLSAEATCASLLAAVEAFSGGASVDDDTTLLVVTYEGPGSA